MMATHDNKPAGIAVVGWLWIISGVLMALSGLLALGMQALMGPMPAHSLDNPELPGFGRLAFMWRHTELLAASQLLVALLAVVAGIQFIRLRAWARALLEGLCWLSLVYILVFAVFWLGLWSDMRIQMAGSELALDPENFKRLGMFAGIVVSVVFAIPLALMIKSLRSKPVRAAMLPPA